MKFKKHSFQEAHFFVILTDVSKLKNFQLYTVISSQEKGLTTKILSVYLSFHCILFPLVPSSKSENKH